MIKEKRFIDVDKATVRGLSSTEVMRMAADAKPSRDVASFDRKLLRDIGIDRSSS